MPPIGLTSGFAFDTIPPISKKVINLIKSFGCDAIELNCIGGHEDGSLAGLANLKKTDFSGYKYVSLHAPSRNIKFRNDEKSRNILEKIEKAHKKLKLDIVVVHPDTIINWKIFNSYSFPVAIENMDNRKKSYKTVKDMESAFKKNPNFRFVLDLNHCYTNDHTMKIAQDFLSSFGDRLCEMHLSGFNKYHASFANTDPLIRKKILEAVPNIDIPIIVENVCDTIQDADADFKFTSNYLKKEVYK